MCPKITQPSWIELVEAVGDPAAYFFFNKNEGKPMDQTPNGKMSPLFKELLASTNGDRIKATQLKAKYYTQEYLSTNDWLSNFIEEPKMSFKQLSTSVETNEIIYSKLGDKTQSENVVIKSWGELKDATKAVTKNGIVATRITGDGKDFNFGNPFASDKDILSKNASLIPTNSIKESVERYINWILTGDIGDAINLKETPEDFEKRTGRRMLMWELNKINALPQELDERRDWILEQLKSGELKGKPIFYYKELGEPSHATALDYLINKYNWETQPINRDNVEQKDIPNVTNVHPAIKELYNKYKDVILAKNPNFSINELSALSDMLTIPQIEAYIQKCY